ncbi:GL11202 [Drosophila persimilis]|uniref:GL11202 n=1 Tax=Drosophila persimilis TaxID=7234 RepID=B4GD33_DROPE|nr:GL11202 [Drosophila persimilis]
MFGSKLRSWMETHIVRPRKKGSKHKQAAAEASHSSGITTGNGKKAGTLPPQGSNLTSPVLTSSGSHSIASPVRRREVSPIQCHPPSRRYGWQSPDEDSYVITSPKSDNLLYAPQCYQPLQQQQHHTHHLSVPNCKDISCAEKSPSKVNCSSSSISSLSWSTGSKEPSSGKQTTFKEHQPNGEYHIPPEEEDEVEYEEVGALLLRPQPPITDYQRPQSENLADMRMIYEKESKPNSNHVRYGRLLPSKLAPAQLGEAADGLTTAPPIPPAASSASAGSRIRTPRGVQRTNFMPGPRPHSLPSPESAYSTGYSTDGTSPCAASNYNPPEYYINMRSGTHYFPKSINSLAIEAQRYKFGLNRIEEMSPMDPLPKSNFANAIHGLESSPNPLALRQQPKLFESPSPRQRCRIRTNPWYNTAEHLPPSSSAPTRLELDATSTTSTTSSGIKSGNELEVPAAKTTAKTETVKGSAYATTTSCKGTPRKSARVGVEGGVAPGGVAYESSEGSSSSTEVENLHAPHTIKRRHLEHVETTTTSAPVAAGGGAGVTTTSFMLSDDEATLNEMIGKFDESYIYEKETDILSSDSDPTDDCASELDTGQDAGDECDTDELLDIDFIDTSSMQEVVLDRQDLARNLGSCQYYFNEPISPLIKRKSSTRSRRKSGQESADGSQQRRRKRFLKTRKKSCENREKLPASPLREPRGSRSVGGTPVCLRRKLLGPKERIYKTSPFSNRSNSMIFGSITEKTSLTIAESEKALLKADLEADIKYKQLIMEAEQMLESMRNSLQSIPRDTPVASPRRVNPLANKRVEMLKHSEESPLGKRRMMTVTSTTATTVFSFNDDDSELECIAVEDVGNINSEEEPQLAPQSNNNNFYCPHSEPLKRKVYKGSSSFERIKKNFDLELDISGRSKSNERSQSKLSTSVSAKSSMHDVTGNEAKAQAIGGGGGGGGSNRKQQLILSTIVDLKRSLEHQSHQLSGLNCD